MPRSAAFQPSSSAMGMMATDMLTCHAPATQQHAMDGHELCSPMLGSAAPTHLPVQDYSNAIQAVLQARKWQGVVLSFDKSQAEELQSSGSS